MFKFDRLFLTMDKKGVSTYRLREECDIDSKTVRRLKVPVFSWSVLDGCECTVYVPYIRQEDYISIFTANNECQVNE